MPWARARRPWRIRGRRWCRERWWGGLVGRSGAAWRPCRGRGGAVVQRRRGHTPLDQLPPVQEDPGPAHIHPESPEEAPGVHRHPATAVDPANRGMEEGDAPVPVRRRSGAGAVAKRGGDVRRCAAPVRRWCGGDARRRCAALLRRRCAAAVRRCWGGDVGRHGTGLPWCAGVSAEGVPHIILLQRHMCRIPLNPGPPLSCMRVTHRHDHHAHRKRQTGKRGKGKQKPNPYRYRVLAPTKT